MRPSCFQPSFINPPGRLGNGRGDIRVTTQRTAPQSNAQQDRRSAIRSCAANPQLSGRTTEIWTAVAERSGDTAFRAWPCFPKRRGASLPAAVQKR